MKIKTIRLLKNTPNSKKCHVFYWTCLSLLENKEIKILENVAFNKVSDSLFSIHFFPQEMPEFNIDIKFSKFTCIFLVPYL